MPNKDLEAAVERLGDKEPFPKQNSDVGEAFANLDKDVTDEENMSQIDFNARLSREETTACMIVDELIGLKILPENVKITRRKKRTSVSIEGKGREEKVRIAAGSQSSKIKPGGWFSRLISRRKDDGEQ